MLPHHSFHIHLWSLAHSTYLLLADPSTPEVLRQSLRKMYKRVKKKLPPDAMIILEAAEAKAAIKAARHLRRDLPSSRSRPDPEDRT